MKINSRNLTNEHGFSIIEVLIAGIIGVLVFGVAVYIFTKQQDVMETENASTNIRAKGRHAIKTLAEELKEIGF